MKRHILRLGLAGLLVAGPLSAPAVPAAALPSAVIQITTPQDSLAPDGFCSLREAVQAANLDQAHYAAPGECPAGAGADTLRVPAGLLARSIPSSTGGGISNSGTLI